MPKTKLESVFFTAITAWTMVYMMTLYNKILESGAFLNATFLEALKGMWGEYVISFLCALLVSSVVAKRLAFRIAQPTDRPIFIILCIQTFTVVSQVTLMSIMGVLERYGLTDQIVPNYVLTWCLNFAVALPAQLLVSGPIARSVFRRIFRRQNG